MSFSLTCGNLDNRVISSLFAHDHFLVIHRGGASYVQVGPSQEKTMPLDQSALLVDRLCLTNLDYPLWKWVRAHVQYGAQYVNLAMSHQSTTSYEPRKLLALLVGHADYHLCFSWLK